MLSPFGVDHPDEVAKSFESKGRKVGWLLGRVQGDMHALAEPTLRERLAGERRGPSMRQHLASSRINEATKGVRGMNTAYKAGYAIDRYRLPRKAVIAGAAAGAAAGIHHRRAVAKSAFGVEHPVSKSRRRDTAAATAGAAAGGLAAPSLHQRAQVKSSANHLAASERHERAAATVGSSKLNRALHETEATRRWHRGYRAAYRARSTPLRVAAGVAGALAGGAGAVAASRKVHKSAFGVEHPVSKVARLDRAVEAVRKPAKVKLAPVKTPLADARFGPVKKGAAAAVDDALVTPARLRVVGAKPQNQVPPAAAKPARPAPGQRLNNAIAATGGSSS